MLLEEVHGALPGELGARVVEAAALVTVEAVLRFGIDEDLAVAAALLLDDLDVGHRDRGILFAEMHQQRHLRLLVHILRDLAAVVGDGCRESRQFAGGEEGDGAAHAEAHDRDGAAPFELVDRGLGILHHRAPVRIGDELARLRDLVRGVAGLEVLHLPVEQRRGDSGVAVSRQPVADCADVMVDAENLLDHDDPALGGPGRIGAISAQLKLVG